MGKKAVGAVPKGVITPHQFVKSVCVKCKRAYADEGFNPCPGYPTAAECGAKLSGRSQPKKGRKK